MMCDSTVTYALANPACTDDAVYATGYTADPADIPAHLGRTLWIDQNGSDPSADVLDIEPGTVLPAEAGPWCAAHRELTGHVCRVYTMRSWWPAVRAAVDASAGGTGALYWIADPTGYPHTIEGADAVQWGWEPTVDYSTEDSAWQSAA